jgi:hypothetical protein
MDQQIGLCIATMQQMESTWNEVSNGPLSYSWQHSDLKMLISSWGTLYMKFSENEAFSLIFDHPVLWHLLDLHPKSFVIQDVLSKRSTVCSDHYREIIYAWT